MFGSFLKAKRYTVLTRHSQILSKSAIVNYDIYNLKKIQRNFTTKIDSSTYYDYINPNGYIKKLQDIQDEIQLKEARVDFYKNPHDIDSLAQLVLSLNRCKNYQESLEICKLNYIKIFFARKIKIADTGTNLWDQVNLAHMRIRKKSIFSYYMDILVKLAIWMFMLSVILDNYVLNPEESALSQLGNDKDFMVEKDVKTRFSDVLGIDEFKDEVQDIVDFLKNPEKYESAGAYIPKGFLLVGSPGTGKTLIARALAGESGCSFFYACGSEFDQIFVGSGAKAIRNQFDQARKNTPALIFIDEIDSLATKRSTSKSSDGSNSTLNQILTELDGFKQNDRIILIGATNNEKSIDPAIKRPGRFDKILRIPLPDVRGREEIIKHYLKGVNHDNKLNTEDLAKKTANYTGADIKNLINLSVIHAVRNHRKSAEVQDFDFAFERILMGIRRKNLTVTEEEKYRTAVYEASKTISVMLQDKGISSQYKVTILPKGDKMGGQATVSDKDLTGLSKKQLLKRIEICMSGRAAEEQFFKDDGISTRCYDDLVKAQKIGFFYQRKMGMQDENIFVSADKEELSDAFNFDIENENSILLKNAYMNAQDLVKKHNSEIQKLAKELCKKETLSKIQVEAIINLNKK